MPKTSSAYLSFIGLSLVIFAAHVLARSLWNMEFWSSIMLQSYGVNVGLGLILIAVAHRLLRGHSTYLGWAFVALSGLKFILFFALIWPDIKQDGATSSAEFSSFFVPYLGCLLFELRFLSKRLNAL
jgi:hypothetical protein